MWIIYKKTKIHSSSSSSSIFSKLNKLVKYKYNS